MEQESSSQTSLILSQTSLQTEYQNAIRKYGEGYVSFLRKYPTLRKRSDVIMSTYDAVRREGMSLSQIDNTFSNGASEWWIKVMLIDLLVFLGAMGSISIAQVKGLASRIRASYYYLTPSELTYFFYSFSMGDYGKLYVGRTINPQDILMGLKEYANMVAEKRGAYENDKRQERMEKEMEENKKKAVTFQKWREMQGLPDNHGNPIDVIHKKLGKTGKQ